MPLPEIFSAKQVAEHLGVSVAIVEQEANRLGCFAKVGRHEFFTLRHVEDLIEAWRPEPAAGRLTAPTPAQDEVAHHLQRRPFNCETLAAEWGVSDSLIRNLVKTGELPHFKVGRMFRISFDAAQEYQQRNQLPERTRSPAEPTPQQRLLTKIAQRSAAEKLERDRKRGPRK